MQKKIGSTQICASYLFCHTAVTAFSASVIQLRFMLENGPAGRVDLVAVFHIAGFELSQSNFESC